MKCSRISVSLLPGNYGARTANERAARAAPPEVTVKAV
jgi:hypothetical protein